MIWHIHKGAHVSRQAEVADSCTIYQGVAVWPYAEICKDVTVGARTKIGRGAYIGYRVKIGTECEIGRRALVPEGVELEDRVRIGPCAILRNEKDLRTVSSGGLNVPDIKTGGRLILVRKGATIGPSAVINQGVTIGRYALVTAGSVLMGDAPDHALMMGNPAEMVGRVCRAGHPLVRQDRHTWYCDTCDEKVRIRSTEDEG
jgi:acetyltransferase-like isoleucine patch superfamily enzyme